MGEPSRCGKNEHGAVERALGVQGLVVRTAVGIDTEADTKQLRPKLLFLALRWPRVGPSVAVRRRWGSGAVGR